MDKQLFDDLFGSDDDEGDQQLLQPPSQQQQQQQPSDQDAADLDLDDEDSDEYDGMQESVHRGAALAGLPHHDLQRYQQRLPLEEMEAAVAAEEDLSLPLEDRVMTVSPSPSIRVDARPRYSRLPNVLSIESHPYSKQQLIAERRTFQGRQLTAEELDVNSLVQSAALAEKRRKLFEGNVMRWRRDSRTGAVESNARLVKWSNGSYQLHIGDEVYDVTEGQFNGEMNHLFVASANVFSCQGRFHKKLAFKPHSTRSMAQQTVNKILRRREKRSKTLITSVVPDEEEVRRKEAEKERKRMEKQQHKAEKDAVGRVSLTSDFLEEGNADGGDISAIKKTYKHGRSSSSSRRESTSRRSKRQRRGYDSDDSQSSSGRSYYSDDDYY